MAETRREIIIEARFQLLSKEAQKSVERLSNAVAGLDSRLKAAQSASEAYSRLQRGIATNVDVTTRAYQRQNTVLDQNAAKMAAKRAASNRLIGTSGHPATVYGNQAKYLGAFPSTLPWWQRSGQQMGRQDVLSGQSRFGGFPGGYARGRGLGTYVGNLGPSAFAVDGSGPPRLPSYEMSFRGRFGYYDPAVFGRETPMAAALGGPLNASRGTAAYAARMTRLRSQGLAGRMLAAERYLTRNMAGALPLPNALGVPADMAASGLGRGLGAGGEALLYASAMSRRGSVSARQFSRFMAQPRFGFAGAGIDRLNGIGASRLMGAGGIAYGIHEGLTSDVGDLSGRSRAGMGLLGGTALLGGVGLAGLAAVGAAPIIAPSLYGLHKDRRGASAAKHRELAMQRELLRGRISRLQAGDYSDPMFQEMLNAPGGIHESFKDRLADLRLAHSRESAVFQASRGSYDLDVAGLAPTAGERIHRFNRLYVGRRTGFENTLADARDRRYLGADRLAHGQRAQHFLDQSRTARFSALAQHMQGVESDQGALRAVTGIFSRLNVDQIDLLRRGGMKNYEKVLGEQGAHDFQKLMERQGWTVDKIDEKEERSRLRERFDRGAKKTEEAEREAAAEFAGMQGSLDDAMHDAGQKAGSDSANNAHAQAIKEAAREHVGPLRDELQAIRGVLESIEGKTGGPSPGPRRKVRA